jgi:hypothetical protein
VYLRRELHLWSQMSSGQELLYVDLQPRVIFVTHRALQDYKQQGKCKFAGSESFKAFPSCDLADILRQKVCIRKSEVYRFACDLRDVNPTVSNARPSMLTTAGGCREIRLF